MAKSKEKESIATKGKAKEAVAGKAREKDMVAVKAKEREPTIATKTKGVSSAASAPMAKSKDREPAANGKSKDRASAPAPAAKSKDREPANGKASAANGKAPTTNGKAASTNSKAPAPVVAAKPVKEAPLSKIKEKELAREKERIARERERERLAASYKCPFPTDELAKWRLALLERRHEISHDIAGLVKDAMEAEDGHTTPNHIAERGSDADLQDMSLGMAGEEEAIIWQIDRALRKIDKAEPLPFGLCEYTKEAIPRLRLQLIPWTPLSIEGATHMEQQNMILEDMLLDD